jgi:hypothetical protein
MSANAIPTGVIPVSRFVNAPLLVAALAVSLAACSQEEPSAPAPASAPKPADTAETAGVVHPQPSAADVVVDLSGIEKAEGGQTVAEIFAAQDQLGGETVLIRAKVVKVNAGIMDRNWLHIRDGSGEAGTNDLTVTTTDTVPSVGDTVLVSGTLGLNRDFGMGYMYPVIVEDAKVTVESGAL